MIRGRASRAAGFLALVAALLASAAPASGQVVSDPNQIRGTIRFTNVNPAILAILEPPGDQGFRDGNVEARSIAPAPPSSASTSAVVGSRILATYELTVEATPAGAAYAVGSRMRVDNRAAKTYVFDAATSAPVSPEPSPDVVLDLESCAGLLDIRFLNPDGTPATVASAGMTIRRLVPGGGPLRWLLEQGGSSGPTSQQYLAYPGSSSPALLKVTYSIGTDPFVDLFVVVVEREVVARCDEIVRVDITVPAGSSDLGRIVGRLDVLGEDEHRLVDRWGVPRVTDLGAWDGPFGNSRRATIDAVPSSGPFVLQNVLSSSNVDPPMPYVVRAAVQVRSGRRHVSLVLPLLDDSNGRVAVGPGEVVDLGETFVVDPGFLRGPVVIRGPDPAIEPRRPALAGIVRGADIDADGDTVPDPGVTRSRVSAFGQAVRAPGAVFSASGASAVAEFEGGFDAATGTFVGDHEIVVGGLAREASYWSPVELLINVEDTATPDDPRTYVDMYASVRFSDPPAILVDPGSVNEVAFRCCLSRVEVTFASTGAPLYAPSLSTAEGTFVGRDAFGDLVAQDVRLAWASGTPLTAAEAATRGLVVALVPQGAYTLQPSLRTVDPGGGTSTTRPPTFDVEVGCGQVIEMTPELIPGLSGVGTCADRSPVEAVIAFDSDARVDSVTLELRGGAPVVLCTNCGLDPSLPVTLDLLPCDNTYRFSAVDALGNVASIAGVVRLDGVAPILTSPGDQVLTVPPDSPCSAPADAVRLPDAALDDCDGSIAPTCDVPDRLPVGVTRVTCRAADRCGNASTIAFDMTVQPGPGGLVVDAGPDALITCPPGSATLRGSVSGSASGVDVAWTPADGVSDPTSAVTEALRPGTYVLTGVDRDTGCSTSDMVVVGVDPASLDEPSRGPGYPPLLVTKGGGGLVITWEPGGNSLYRGAIDSLWWGRAYDHAALSCGLDGGDVQPVEPGTSFYLLVTRTCGGLESSYGRSSLGIERPEGLTRCP